MNVYTVTEVTKYLKNIVENDGELKALYLRGEISNYKLHSSGHAYFTLKDAGAVIRCVMFRQKVQYLRFRPTNGLKVVVGGAIRIYERDGQYQLYAERMLPEGVGELSLAYEQLKAKLTEEGLFDEGRKKPLPMMAKKIGIVTSRTGAVLRDILKVGKRRDPYAEFILYPVQVQGETAAREIAAAVRSFNEKYPVDVLIVGRGGGSLEDLWAFNEEIVVRAVASSKIPIVSAVGHETDCTLTDFAADVRAATPSHAAQLAVSDHAQWTSHIAYQRARILRAAEQQMKEKGAQLAVYSKERLAERLRRVIEQKQQTADMLMQRAVQTVDRAFTEKKHRFAVARQRLVLLDPEQALRRGYSILTEENGRLVRSCRDIEEGALLTGRLPDGQLTLQVRKKEFKNEKNREE